MSRPKYRRVRSGSRKASQADTTPQKNRHIGLVLFALLLIASVFVAFGQRSQQKPRAGGPALPALTSPVPVTTPVVTTPVTTLVPPALKPNQAGHKQSSGASGRTAAQITATAAVSAAAKSAFTSISESKFWTDAQRTEVINAWVVPSARTLYNTNLGAEGKALLVSPKGMGYPTVDAGLKNVKYYVLPLRAKVLFTGTTTAKVHIFYKSHFVTLEQAVTGFEQPDLNIMVVLMRRMNGKWLFAGWANAPANETPKLCPQIQDPTKCHPKFARKYQDYLPIVEDFHD